MVKLYSDRDYWDAYMQRRKLLAVFLAVTFAVLAAFAAVIAFYVELPYQSPDRWWLTLIPCVMFACYIIFAFLFMGIKFKRCNAYCRMLKYISLGLKETAELPFEEIDDWMTQDGVDMNVAVFFVANIKQDDVLKRRIFVDGEKDFPPFEKGKWVRIVSQGNLLIEYELLDG